jgi:intracellular sulfur oxidation DsrE/DsrF family protein
MAVRIWSFLIRQVFDFRQKEGQKLMGNSKWINVIAIGGIIVCSLNLSYAWEYPVIKGYGPVHPLPKAAVQPDKSVKYKALFDVTQGSKGVDKANPGLGHVARFINVMASAGLLPEDMELVAVVHGGATPALLKNEVFKSRFKKDNPNLRLIKELKEAKVKLYVCGQALADDGFKEEWVNEEIQVVLSALVVVPTFQLKGYAYLPLF